MVKLYGLKQASRAWYKKISKHLKKLGFKQNKYEPCVFTKITGNIMMIIALYVDDFVLLTNSTEEKDKLFSQLKKNFDINDLGLAKDTLGLRIIQKDGLITIDQRKYIKEILAEFKMEDCNPVGTPMGLSVDLSFTRVTGIHVSLMDPRYSCERKIRGQAPMETNATFKFLSKKESITGSVPYRELMGHLTYLSIRTRPDIAHAVRKLSQFNTNHSLLHWKAAKRILRYLKGTVNLKLSFSKSSKPLTGWVDADWGQDVNDRKSYSSYLFKFANAVVSWDSKKQRSVALSTAEAEYMAMSEITKEAIFLRRFMQDILGKIETTQIYSDSQSALSLTENEIVNNRTKNIDIRYHFVRDEVANNVIRFSYVNTNAMIADFLTKPVCKEKHSRFTKLIGLKEN